MKENKDYELVIVGAGPAGLTAGMYGVRSGLDTVIVEKGISGGLANEAPVIENYPGFKRIEGMKLIQKLKEQVEEYVEIKELEGVDKIEVMVEEAKMAVFTEKARYISKAVIISTGTKHRILGVKGEKAFLGRGISYCATCDGFLFRNKHVIVVGGGDSAAEEALYLNNIGCNVMLVHRRGELRATKYLREKLENAGVPVRWDSVIKEITGEKVVKSVIIYDRKRGVQEEISVEGIFVSIGEEPNNELAAQIGVKIDDENGYIITDKNQRTNVERVYAAGDVTGGVKQIVVACAKGAIAATSAYNDLLKLLL